MRSVAIHHPTDPTRPKTIRADRYNPSVHRLWTEGATDVSDDAEGVDPEDGADPQERNGERAGKADGELPGGDGQADAERAGLSE